MDQQWSFGITAGLVHLPPELQEGRGRGRGPERRPGEVLEVCYSPRLPCLRGGGELERRNGNGTTADLAVLKVKAADDVILGVRVLGDQPHLRSEVRGQNGTETSKTTHTLIVLLLTGIQPKHVQVEKGFKLDVLSGDNYIVAMTRQEVLLKLSLAAANTIHVPWSFTQCE